MCNLWIQAQGFYIDLSKMDTISKEGKLFIQMWYGSKEDDFAQLAYQTEENRDKAFNKIGEIIKAKNYPEMESTYLTKEQL